MAKFALGRVCRFRLLLSPSVGREGSGGAMRSCGLPPIAAGLAALGCLGILMLWIAGCGMAAADSEREDSPRLVWCWSGAVTDRSATVAASIGGAETATLLLLDDQGRRLGQIVPEKVGEFGMVRFDLEDLSPLTTYQYRFEIGGAVHDGGRFTTMPVRGSSASFSFAFGACNSARDNPTFRAIAHQNPLFFIHTGDLHYSDIRSNDPQDFHAAMDRVLTDPAQSVLYRSRGVVYMWDDHDYGPNDSRYDNPSRQAAHLVYRRVVPHHPLVLTAESEERAAPIAQAFTVGRVRFVVPDLRSEHSRERGSLMGSRQREWFLAELRRSAEDHVLIVFVSSVPWIARQGNDHWGAAQEERRIIANFIKEHRIPVCIIAGDAHMVAIDDGRNADYADDGGAAIPVFQAGALGRRGSYKGGPYSHGANPGPNQFGIFHVTDAGQTVRVQWSARNGEDGRGDTVVRATRDGDQPIEYSFQWRTRR